MAATGIVSAEVPASRAAGVGLAVAAMATIQLGAAVSEPMFDRLGSAGVVALNAGLGGRWVRRPRGIEWWVVCAQRR